MPSKTPSTEPSITFETLGLKPELLAVLTELGYEEPTPIQKSAIPALLSGRDVVGQAATGTGKTGAFALPMLQRLDVSKVQPFSTAALIIVPTRELAIQVAEATHTYGRKLDVGVLPIYGGQPISQQLQRLRRGVHVVIATPGRALDHLRRKTLKLDSVSMVVVDEADELLDLGFADDLDELLAAVPDVAQVALFSATLPPRIAKIADRHLDNPIRIRIESNPQRTNAQGNPKIAQIAYVIPRSHKEVALGRVLDLEAPASAIIFCRTRLEVEHLTQSLTARGYNSAALHGGLDQPMRDRVIKKFKSGDIELLIATDVAGRGLDVERLTHVINYDLPSNPEDYVHRIGRTGRAGREGRAISFCEPKEHRFLRVLEGVTGNKIELARVPTVVDLKNRRLEVTRAAVEEALGAEGLDSFRTVAEQLSSNTDPLEVAAAAIFALHAQLAPPEQDEKDIPEFRPGTGSPRDRDSSGPRGDPRGSHRGVAGAFGKAPRREAGPREDRTKALGGRLFVSIGKSAGLRPADLVGAIANEAGLSRDQIGAIQIAEHHAFVDVAEDQVETVIEALKKTTVRGRKVRIDRDHGGMARADGATREAAETPTAGTGRSTPVEETSAEIKARDADAVIEAVARHTPAAEAPPVKVRGPRGEVGASRKPKPPSATPAAPKASAEPPTYPGPKGDYSAGRHGAPKSETATETRFGSPRGQPPPGRFGKPPPAGGSRFPSSKGPAGTNRFSGSKGEAGANRDRPFRGGKPPPKKR